MRIVVQKIGPCLVIPLLYISWVKITGEDVREKNRFLDPILTAGKQRAENSLVFLL